MPWQSLKLMLKMESESNSESDNNDASENDSSDNSVLSALQTVHMEMRKRTR